jgi:hypothetical protein
MMIKSYQNFNTECVESGKTKQDTLVSQSISGQSMIDTVTSNLEKGSNNE